jgi:hypothetical protein
LVCETPCPFLLVYCADPFPFFPSSSLSMLEERALSRELLPDDSIDLDICIRYC